MENSMITNSQQQLEQPINMFVATSMSDKLEIYRLRYQVYAEEMGRKLTDADHENGLLFDELDAWSHVVCAKLGSKVIGSVRLTLGYAGDFSQSLVETLHMDKFQKFGNGQHKLCFASKYVVDPAYRSTQAGYLLLRYLDNLCREQRVQFNLAGCNPYLITFYERVGYRRFADSFHVPEYGCMVPLVWLIEDVQHLRNVRSSYLRNASKWSNDSAAATWFAGEFPEAAGFMNSRLISEADLWETLRHKLGQAPERKISALAGLTEDTARKFVQMGVIHSYKQGGTLLSAGSVSNEMNILLTGSLTAEQQDSGGQSLRPKPSAGQIFGRVSLTGMTEQTETVKAETDGEYLIIPGAAFEKYRQQHPEEAKQILANSSSTRI